MFSLQFLQNLGLNIRHKFFKIHLKNSSAVVLQSQETLLNFLPVISLSRLIFFSTSTTAGENFYLNVNPRYAIVALLSIRYQFRWNGSSFIDSCGFYTSTNTGEYCSVITLANFLGSTRYTLFLKHIFERGISMVSLSSLWAGAEWVEREWRELDGIYFMGMRDTRKLLHDYSSGLSLASGGVNVRVWEDPHYNSVFQCFFN